MHLDIEPRENKYGHAAVWGLIPGYSRADGSRNYPVAAMVANLAKETPEKPALLSHDNVVTFFHEMVRLDPYIPLICSSISCVFCLITCSITLRDMLSISYAARPDVRFLGTFTRFLTADVCDQTSLDSRFHGTSVARDFVEAPSQMLENWCWTESQLSRMSQHYQRPEEKLPQELIKKIIASRDLNSGLFNLRQLFFGMCVSFLFRAYVFICDSRSEQWAWGLQV